MTDTLRDLLHESVADVDMPDVAELAWTEGGRVRRRRAVSAVAGAAAVVLTLGGVVWAVDQRDSDRAAQPVRSPSPTTEPTSPAVTSSPSTDKADGEYHGTSVWWAPSVAREAALPAYPGSPLPPDVDVSQVGREIPSTMPPVGVGLAAFAVVGDAPGHVSSVGVLGSDGVVRLVDTSRVQPMRDPEGNLRVRVGPSMLSPTGEYLMFPQHGSIRLLRLADDTWSTIDTGSQPTWDATWADGSADRIVLWDSERPDAAAPVYDVSGARVGGSVRATDFLNPRFGGDMYGLPRRSPNGSLAQSYVAGLDVPQPPALHLSPGQSDSIGIASAPDAMLVLPQETDRWKQCCQVAGWLDRYTLVYESHSSQGMRLLAWRVGTHRFWRVSDVVGWTSGQEYVVSSYARLLVPEECCSG
jgi:hypothetical protein